MLASNSRLAPIIGACVAIVAVKWPRCTSGHVVGAAVDRARIIVEAEVLVNASSGDRAVAEVERASIVVVARVRRRVAPRAVRALVVRARVSVVANVGNVQAAELVVAAVVSARLPIVAVDGRLDAPEGASALHGAVVLPATAEVLALGAHASLVARTEPIAALAARLRSEVSASHQNQLVQNRVQL
mgnify:CR=1 FL=1